MFFATIADGKTAASWGQGRRIAILNRGPLLDGSQLGGPLGGR